MRAIKAGVLCGCMVLAWLAALPVAHSQEWLYTVRPGDNLWSITAEHLVRMDYWPKLQALNGVANPGQLPPGSKLRIPIAWLKRLPAMVQVISVQGQAQATLAATGQIVSIQVGQFLESGDSVQTGPDSNITLEFGDGSRTLVQADSQLILERLRSRGRTNVMDTVLSLLQGRVENRVIPRLEAGSRYQISTPVATSAVRGTHYRFGMDSGAEIARTEVLEGGVTFQGERGSRSVGKGFGALAQAGKPLAPPVALLAAPDTKSLPPVVTRVPIQLRFAALKGAVAYRAQIASTERFETLLFDGSLALPGVRGPDLPDGDYVLRLRAIDAQGLEGRDAYHRFRLHARPEPPLLIYPAHESAVLAPSLRFEWSEPAKAVAYHFQLADDEGFATPLLDIADHLNPKLTPERTLEPRRYYWRVAVRDNTGREGPFSDSQRVRVQPVLALQPPEVAAETMTFRWGAGLPGQKYEFQMARDTDFEDVIVSRQVSEPQLTVPRPDSGFHYLRMRSIDTDGFIGPYGATQRIDVPPASYWPAGWVTFLALILVL